ncbi:hypothetical protein ACTHGU_04240 [Chitinophagaceae bacterium MMS25-I14]
MNRFIAITAFTICVAGTFTADAQKSKSNKKAKHSAQTAKEVDFNTAKQKIYFPDYYTFYDPARKSFVYWDENQWKTSSEKPALLKDADMGRTRVQFLKDENLALPEDNIERYMKLYPAQPVSPTVTVPIITISRKKK